MDSVIQVEPFSLFNEVISDLLQNLYTNNIITDPGVDIKSAKNEVKKLILINNFNIEALVDYYKTKSWDSAKKDCFINALKENKTKILLATLQDHNSTYGEVVVDFNWLLKIAFGTSELKANVYPVLQLILCLYSKSEQRNEIYDINKTTLRKLIDILENFQEIK